MSANHAVNRLRKYAQIVLLQSSWFLDLGFEKVWHKIVNYICIWVKTNLKNTPFEKITFICVGKGETTSENSSTELCAERGTRLSASREVNRLPKYAPIAFLQML